LLDLKHRFRLCEVRYDPYQMQASAQRLRQAGINMVDFPQSLPNLTSASQNLYELIKAQNLVAYPDPDLRLAVQRSIAVENARGWRIAKEKSSHKIDVVVALAMAATTAQPLRDRASRPRRQRDKAMTITPGALCVSRGTDHFPAQLSADSFLA
jgi:phage terminase large subunit-like protein